MDLYVLLYVILFLIIIAQPIVLIIYVEYKLKMNCKLKERTLKDVTNLGKNNAVANSDSSRRTKLVLPLVLRRDSYNQTKILSKIHSNKMNTLILQGSKSTGKSLLLVTLLLPTNIKRQKRIPSRPTTNSRLS